MFFILIQYILALYIQYNLNKAINIFFPQNLADSVIKENATGTGNGEEGALLNENISDSQRKKKASEEKNKVTENSVFDLTDVITGHKIVRELTREEKYYYLTKHY